MSKHIKIDGDSPNKPIIRLTEIDGRLFGCSFLEDTVPPGGQIFNLLPKNLGNYDFNQVIEGKELLEKYLKIQEENEQLATEVGSFLQSTENFRK